jgi:hypothetical protein
MEMATGCAVLEDMAWTTRKYSKNKVDRAGDTLIDPNTSGADKEAVLDIINNWRSSHAFPLNTFQNGLRSRSRGIDQDSLVAQRIKRLPAIEFKLKHLPHLKLSEMQDIGGCRAVVGTVPQVQKLVADYQNSHVKHKLHKCSDYIKRPKDSGYRGVHLVYKYLSDRQETYNGLKIELQLRSRLQHAWATAVETVDTFTRQALKSSVGKPDWLRFFALMGSAIAIREKSAPVPNTPVNPQALRQEIREYAERLDVERVLLAFGSALRTTRPKPGKGRAHYFLLELNPTAKRTKITGFRMDELPKAAKEYLAAEHAIADLGADAVLVSVDSVKSLRRAYPNYFLDTRVFLQILQDVLGPVK